MKKVLVAVALVMGLGSSVAFAQEVENSTAVETQAQAPQDEFTKIDAKKLPDAVMNALAKSYEGASIKEVIRLTKRPVRFIRWFLQPKILRKLPYFWTKRAKR